VDAIDDVIGWWLEQITGVSRLLPRCVCHANLFAMEPNDFARALATPGRASIAYTDPLSPDRALVVECYRPPSHLPDSPVVLVQHGMGRNGDEYCEAWIPAANKHGLLIVATTFPEAAWPDPRHYNDGHVLEEDGSIRARQTWSQAIPGRVFAMLRQAEVTRQDKAYLWGHSAGGQFVHRLMATQPHELFHAVGPANAGWYTMPTLDLPYPEGLGGIGVTSEDTIRLLGYPMVIFAGDRDIETEASNLPRHPAALAQGPHRFARAHTYLARGQAEAARLGVPCNWRLVVVPGIGHEGMRMSAIAAAYWFDGEMPQAPAADRPVTTEL
jgi:pimeloyl-ACP methyl ester carboxylesterase